MFPIRFHRGAAYILLSAAVLLSASVSAMPAAAVSAPAIKGDCNSDGVISKEDVLLLRDHLTIGTALAAPVHADLNSDRQINGQDLTLLKRLMLYPADPVESMTIMLYLCGSDLETQAEQATRDLDEIIAAADSEQLNIVIATGGAKEWSSENTYADSAANYYITCTAEGVTSAPCADGIVSMAKSSTLSDFIDYAAEACPADRYALILWDHGGGPVYGLCYDELYDKSLSIASLEQALSDADVFFEWIGFDCCLMGCAEIAYTIREHANYMIASEESESGLGWAYTRFLSALAETPDIATEELAHMIISDMISENRRYQQEATLALYDLQQAEAVMLALYDYIDDIYAIYCENGISAILTARSNAQDFGDGEYDLVDLVHLADLLPTEHSQTLTDAIDAMVLEEKSYRVENANGVAAWFFENYPNEAIYLDYTMKQCGIDEEYITKLKKMASATQAAKAADTAGIQWLPPAHEDNIITSFARWFASMQQ